MECNYENGIIGCFCAQGNEETGRLAEIRRAIYLAFGEDDDWEYKIPERLPHVAKDKEEDKVMAEAPLHESEPLECNQCGEQADRSGGHARNENSSALCWRECAEC